MESMIKFSFTVLCFTIALISYKFCFSKRDWLFLSTGMAFTLISDFFLMLSQNHLMGVVTFCFVQTAYIFRATHNNPDENLKSKNLKFILGILLCSIPVFIFLDPLIAAALIYTCLFILDIVTTGNSYKNSGGNFSKINRFLILSGIVLFAVSDVFVLLYNLPNYISMPGRMQRTAYLLIWAFYLPSQFLLSISGFKYKARQNTYN